MSGASQYGGTGRPYVVLWRRAGRWWASAYAENGVKADDTTDLGIPEASEMAAIEVAARVYEVPAELVALTDPGEAGGPRG